jgi:hypothetical protein
VFAGDLCLLEFFKEFLWVKMLAATLANLSEAGHTLNISAAVSLKEPTRSCMDDMLQVVLCSWECEFLGGSVV